MQKINQIFAGTREMFSGLTMASLIIIGGVQQGIACTFDEDMPKDGGLGEGIHTLEVPVSCERRSDFSQKELIEAYKQEKKRLMQLAESMINKGINIIDRRKVAFAVILDGKEKEKHEVRLLPGQMSVLVVQYKGDRTTTYSLTNGENGFSELTKKILSDLRYIKAEDTVK